MKHTDKGKTAYYILVNSEKVSESLEDALEEQGLKLYRIAELPPPEVPKYGIGYIYE